MRTRGTLAAVAAGTFLAALLLTGCSSSDGTGSTPSEGGPSSGGTTQTTPSAEAYAECMRDNGVEMSDPDPSTGVPQFGDSVDPSSAAVQAAIAECQDLMPAGIRGDTDDQDLEVYLAFSKCMRENGMPDFPDPQPGPNGMFGDSGVNRSDPVYQQAAQACASILNGE